MKKISNVEIIDFERLFAVENFELFRKSISEGLSTSRYVISDGFELNRPSMALRVGKNAFFQSETEGIEKYDAVSRRHNVELLFIPNGVFSPFSHSVMTSEYKVYESSLDTSSGTEEVLHSLTNYDPLFSGDGKFVSINRKYPLRSSGDIAVPICGPGYPNFGHFLYDGLGLAIFLKSQNLKNLRFVGAAARPWQLRILDRLGILGSFKEVFEPTRFKGVIASSMLYGHLAYPTRFIRPVFDMLRLTTGPGQRKKFEKVYISRGQDVKRPISNRLDVEALLKNRGYFVFDPLSFDLDEAIRMVGSSSIIVGESGAGMGNIGFCETGTKILEIQQPNFMDGWTRATCDVMGFDWSLYLTSSSTSERDGPQWIDLQKFSAALDILESTG